MVEVSNAKKTNSPLIGLNTNSANSFLNAFTAQKANDNSLVKASLTQQPKTETKTEEGKVTAFAEKTRRGIRTTLGLKEKNATGLNYKLGQTVDGVTSFSKQMVHAVTGLVEPILHPIKFYNDMKALGGTLSSSEKRSALISGVGDQISAAWADTDKRGEFIGNAAGIITTVALPVAGGVAAYKINKLQKLEGLSMLAAQTEKTGFLTNALQKTDGVLSSVHDGVTGAKNTITTGYSDFKNGLQELGAQNALGQTGKLRTEFVTPANIVPVVNAAKNELPSNVLAMKVFQWKHQWRGSLLRGFIKNKAVSPVEIPLFRPQELNWREKIRNFIAPVWGGKKYNADNLSPGQIQAVEDFKKFNLQMFSQLDDIAPHVNKLSFENWKELKGMYDVYISRGGGGRPYGINYANDTYRPRLEELILSHKVNNVVTKTDDANATVDGLQTFTSKLERVYGSEKINLLNHDDIGKIKASYDEVAKSFVKQDNAKIDHTLVTQTLEDISKTRIENLESLRKKLGVTSPHLSYEMEKLKLDDLAYIQSRIGATTEGRDALKILDDAVPFRQASQNHSLKELDEYRQIFSSVRQLNGGAAMGKRVSFDIEKLSYGALADWKDTDNWLMQLRATKAPGSSMRDKDGIASRIGSLWMDDQSHHMQQYSSLSPIQKLGGIKGVKQLEAYRDGLVLRGPKSDSFTHINKFTYDDLVHLKGLEDKIGDMNGVNLQQGVAGFMNLSHDIGLIRAKGFEGEINYALENVRRRVALRANTYKSIKPDQMSPKLTAEQLTEIETLFAKMDKATSDTEVLSLNKRLDEIGMQNAEYVKAEKHYSNIVNTERGRWRDGEYEKLLKEVDKDTLDGIDRLRTKVFMSQIRMDNTDILPLPEALVAPHRAAVQEFHNGMKTVYNVRDARAKIELLAKDVGFETALTRDDLMKKITADKNWLSSSMDTIASQALLLTRVEGLPKEIVDDLQNAADMAATAKRYLDGGRVMTDMHVQSNALQAIKRLVSARQRVAA